LYHPSHRDSAYIVLPPNPAELHNLGYLPQLAPYRYARDRYSIVTRAQGCINQPHELQLREQEYLNQVIWFTGDSTAGVANSMVGKRVFANYTTPGRYTVTAYAEYCNRWDTLRYTVDILGLPPAAPVTDTVFCAGGSLTLTLPAGLSYRWSDGDTSGLKSFTTGGSYWLESSNACYTRRDSFVLRTQEAPAHGLPADTSLCAGDVLVLAPQAGDFRWQWSDGSTLPREVQGGGTHILLLENSCGTFPWRIQVWERTPPEPRLPSDTSICEGQLLRIALDDDPRTSYRWSDGSTERIRLLGEAGSYEVVATNACGTGSAQLNLATEDCACTLYAPTAFSPNDDGLNERYAIVTRCVLSDFRMLVYNRWGELVYSSQSLDQGWDGTIDGKPAPPGNYVYQLSYYREGLGPRQSSGSFVLLR
jgi:gliding motility-associated-like protein